MRFVARTDAAARRAIWVIVAAVVLLAAAWAAGAVAASEPSSDRKSVLILLPGQLGLPAAAAVAAGVRSALLNQPVVPVSVEIEHVDLARFKGTDYEHHLRALFAFKYRSHPPDAIVAAQNEVLEFALRSRAELWPEAPIVVCAVDERTLSGFTPPPGVSVITLRYDMAGTLAAALALLPDTRHVALVGGASAQERGFHDLARQAVGQLHDRVDLIDLTGPPLEAVIHRVSMLPEHTVVLASSFQVDGAGHRFYGVEIVPPISAATNSPMFTVFGTLLGRGVVGGSMVDFEAVGREAGDLVLHALRRDPAPRPWSASAASNVLLFDAREIERWGLLERRLPPNSRVLFRRPGIWRQYRWYILSAAALLALQAALILALLVERRSRQEAQRGLVQRLRFEALLERISTALARVPAARMDEQIRDCLGWIAAFFSVDRGTLWQPSGDRRTLTSTHHWSAAGADPPPARIHVSALPALQDLVDQGASVMFTSPDELDGSNEPGRRALERIGVRSMLAIPLRIDQRILGVLAFTTLRASRVWPPELVQRLQPLSEMFANALMRQRAAAELETSEALTSAVLTALPAEAAIVDGRGMITQVNDAWSAATRELPTDQQAAMGPGASYLDACCAGIAMPGAAAPRAVDLMDAVLAGRQVEGAVEYACLVHGAERWREMRVQRLSRPAGAAVMHFDITDRKRADAEARRHLAEAAHMDRVAAMAELASSLAHELNQPLTAILSNAQAAQRILAASPPAVDEVRECLADIVQDDRRAGEVIRRIRRLLKKEESVDRVPFDLNAVVENAIDLVSNEAMLHRVSLDFSGTPALPLVHGDAIQVQQVVLNLLTNAITAAAAAPTGAKVSVWTALVNGQVELGVHDSGAGIATDPEDVFRPFFTTKPDGLGMGLAISRSIVNAHGGRIWAENAAGGGASFRARFPVSHEAADK